jgi:hypothetical protein
MSLKTKKRFKNIGRVVAGALFALLMFTNIKVALMDDAEILSGDISLLGVELGLFEATYACNDCLDGPCCEFGRYPWWNPVSNSCVCPVNLSEADCDCCGGAW